MLLALFGVCRSDFFIEMKRTRSKFPIQEADSNGKYFKVMVEMKCKKK